MPSSRTAASRNDHVAERHVGHQDTGAAAGDERPAPSRDQLFEEPCRERRSNSWVDEGQTPPVVGELVDRVATDLGHHVIDRATVVLGDDLLDHVLEEAENDMGGMSIGSIVSDGSITAVGAGSNSRIGASTTRGASPLTPAVPFETRAAAPRMTNAMPAIERSGTRLAQEHHPQDQRDDGYQVGGERRAGGADTRDEPAHQHERDARPHRSPARPRTAGRATRSRSARRSTARTATSRSMRAPSIRAITGSEP